MKRAAMMLIRTYQKCISPLIGPHCRFIPTCSQYAYEAFERYGFIKGLYLSIKRLFRCNPLCKGGYDPVP
ncbi:MAG: membrane protein insertion efficiency factor YidD [Eubacteriaceae bacterium]|nr:membrane protein insertion efficiency factor YidD [Eubacteriaceae bacterium]